ncbi:MAG: cation:proton antiporter [Caldimonas sp.]
MDFALWSAIIGLLLVVMALGDSVLARLPLSTSMLYVLVGVAVSPLWLDLSSLTPVADAALLEHVAEVVVLLSLFTAGMKMSLGLGDGRWLLPLRLAVLSMLVTVAAIAAVGVFLLDLPVGAAILLGGILAPTDPVLASEVELENAGDRDRLRFSLTGEAGLNDGTAFPIVFLGLGLLGLHDIGPGGLRWISLDVVWGTACGLGVGAALGTVVGKLVLYLRRAHKEATGLDNFLALGLIALSYGVAQLAHGLGFLAVFAAGVALRRIEQQETRAATESAGGKEPADAAEPVEVAEQAAANPDPSHAAKVAVHPKHAPAFMAHAMSTFNEQIERIGEVAAVILIGMMLWAVDWSHARWWFVLLLIVVIRPASVAIGLLGSHTLLSQRTLIGWFGIRGIGSLYYVMYAMNHGLPPEVAQTLLALTLSTMVASITVHGISVTPLMALYQRTRGRGRAAGARRVEE